MLGPKRGGLMNLGEASYHIGIVTKLR